MKPMFIQRGLARFKQSIFRKALLLIHPYTTLQALKEDFGCTLVVASPQEQLPSRPPENIEVHHLPKSICIGDPQYKQSFQSTCGQIIPETIIANIGPGFITKVIKPKSGEWFGIADRRKRFLRMEGLERDEIHSALLWAKKSEYIETGVLIFDYWFTNYYHWLVCCLPKALAAMQMGHGDKLLLPRDFQSRPYITESLRLIGLDVSLIKTLESYKTKVNNLITISSTRVSPLLLAETRKRVMRHNEKLPSKPRLDTTAIYISRANASHRRLRNEDEILDICHHFNVSCIHAEGHDFIEQISIFQNVQTLVGFHGAGLTNMIWMPDGSNVVEIQSQELMFPHYYQLALATNKRYWHVDAHLETEKSNFQGDCYANIDMLKHVLEKIFARNGE